MSEAVILTNAHLITPFDTLFPGTVVCREGVIVEVYEGLDSRGEDLKGLLLVPGFIDLHSHGAYGYDPSRGSGEPDLVSELAGMSRSLLKNGVTAFLPTLVSFRHERLLGLLEAFGDLLPALKDGGATPLGVWLEGPYLAPAHKGAHSKGCLRPPDQKELSLYAKLAKGTLKGLTLAPELPGALDLTSLALSLGLKVAIGHTGASFKETKMALHRGADRATHLFNAMPPIHHRNPGPALALLESQNVYLELICDLVHVAPEILCFVKKAATVQRLIAVTDQISATGMPEGQYSLGGLKVHTAGRVARLSDGTLAGSLLTMDTALENLVKTGFSLNEAALMLSLNPARSLGIPNRGAILPGFRADFALLNPKLEVLGVYKAGQLVYKRPSQEE